jgi:hypothetical protein
MSNIVVFRPRERIRQDGEAIAALYRNLGTATAEQLVTRALGELALTMSGLDAQVRARDLADLTRQLRRLQRMAENLGMISLSAVAGDAGACLQSGDSTAFSYCGTVAVLGQGLGRSVGLTGALPARLIPARLGVQRGLWHVLLPAPLNTRTLE